MIPEKKKPHLRVFFHSRYDKAGISSPHLKGAKAVFEEFFTFSSLEEADFSIMLDLDRRTQRLTEKALPSPRQRFLILREPRQVHPDAHTKRTSKRFNKVFFTGAASGVDHDTTPWPYTTGAALPEPPPGNLLRKDRVVAIAGWRVSFLSGSLYSLRAEALSKLDVDTFGRGWHLTVFDKAREVVAQLITSASHLARSKFEFRNQVLGQPRNYFGAIENKASLLQRYKVSLVIENSADYMSEKVLDALWSGCIPVYVGPNLSQFGIPSELVFQCQPEMESLRIGISDALTADYSAWHSQLTRWRQSVDGRKCFDENLAWRSLALQIQRCINGN